ncbi:F-box domain-containing protein [Mycena venus]|uniref:F-box domain-containing protein n=1 Tax=Mycena venus TaxID=2733690 RepID=A0A8H6Y121_9AGAR|nr:F-box domain-containing protein [Mycena venus]
MNTLAAGRTFEDSNASPIGRLLPELLCSIFTLAVPAQKYNTPSVFVVGRRSWDGPVILGVPWVFGQVCSEWRMLATCLPALWTSITLTTTLLPRDLPLLHTQLARSGTALLDVFIRFTVGPHRLHAYENNPSAKEPFGIFLPSLIAQSSRWRTLHIQFEGYAHDDDDLSLPGLNPDALPHLEELRFTGDTLNSHIQPFDLFGEAPALRCIALGIMGGFAKSPLRLRWDQLTTYKATCRNAAVHLRNLAAAPALVECDISFENALESQIRGEGAVVTLLHLRRLAVSHPAFLDRIATPALKSLYVVGPEYYRGLIKNTGPVLYILPFLQRSECTLQLAELTLVDCPSPVPEIVALLQQTSGLTSLSLKLSRSPPSFANDLVTALAAPNSLCPALQSLSWADFDDALDREAFADMVASRCSESTAVCRLHFVSLYAGRQRMKTAGWRVRALPRLEATFLNAKKGRPAVRKWRED